MSIAAGSLTERITLLRAVCTTEPNGEVREWFAEYATVRAQVLQQRSSKALAHGEAWYPTARSFRMRIPPRVQGGDRIRYNGELYVCLPPKVFRREGVQEVDCELLTTQDSSVASLPLTAAVDSNTLSLTSGAATVVGNTLYIVSTDTDVVDGELTPGSDGD